MADFNDMLFKHSNIIRLRTVGCGNGGVGMSTGQIFEWESVTLPSYWNGQILTETGLRALDQLVATGANTVTIIPNFFQTDKFSNSVELHLGDPNNPWDNESDTFEQVKQSILAAKARGLEVVVKPHLETNNRVWRAELAPTDPKAWFESYKAMMVEYAKAAQEAGAAMLCVGTEMDSMIDPTKVCSDGKTYTQKWAEIIDAVRAVYSGKVTYAATYWTVKDVGFWDKVDYIGTDAYIPSSTVNNPTVDQIVDAWIKPHFNSWVREVNGNMSVVDYYKSLSEQYGKKVIFTEVGYRSMDGANRDPGSFGGTGEYDPQEQVDCYNALFKVMENYGGQWLAGSFIWSYYSFENPMEERGVSWTDYTTQHKPANVTITTHYSGPAHTTGLVRNGTAIADKLDGGYHNDTLNGAAGIDALWGGAGHDVLNGGTGNDRMEGGANNDTYYVDSRWDVVTEANFGGIDLVCSAVSYTLSAYVEKLTGLGSGAIALTGNTLANTLTGNSARNTLKGLSGSDILNGGKGSDVLYGGTGKDVFVFTTAPSSSSNKDRILDWNYRDDTIKLENAVFKKLTKTGGLSKASFVIGAAAKDSNDFVGYNKATGDLWYDANGNKAGGQVAFANIGANKAITYNDFVVI